MFKPASRYSYAESIAKMEKPVYTDNCMPDQHMSIQQMLIRHAQGLPQTGMRDPIEFTSDPYGSVSDEEFDDHTYGDFDDEMDVIDHVKMSQKDKRKAREILSIVQKQKELEKTKVVSTPVNSTQTTT